MITTDRDCGAVPIQLSDAGLDTSVKIVSHVGPQPAHEIADLARGARADLILVGCRGHAAIAGLLLGSVTTRLLHVSPCPVLVIPQGKLPASETAAELGTAALA